MATEWSEWEAKVLRSFLDGERLVRLPARWKKRMVLLRWLVEKFEPDRRYPQAELNGILAMHHPDTATIRREFIVYGLMDRKDSVYWRTDRPSPEVR
jgi:hypothetical protein